MMSDPGGRGLAAAVSAAVYLAGMASVGCAQADNQPSGADTMDAIEQSIQIYREILSDVDKNYDQRGGGGISSIRQESTNRYVVQISQEGRKDLITYEVSVGAQGEVSILAREQDTKSY